MADDQGIEYFSRDEAWLKAEEIRDYLMGDKDNRPIKAGIFLRYKPRCVEVRVYYRTADISGSLEDKLSGMDFFIDKAKNEEKSGKDMINNFPYFIYRVPYKNPYSSR